MRPFQQSATLLVTQAFKTAPNYALLILSNLLPIELRIAEVAATRFLSWLSYRFTKSSLDTISKIVQGLQAMPKIDVFYRRYLLYNPPWRESAIVNIMGPTDQFDLCPSRPGVVRIYVGSWKHELCGFKIVNHG